MGFISESINAADYLTAGDVGRETVAFIDADLYFDDGSVEQSSSAIVKRSTSEITTQRVASNIGDVLRSKLFSVNEDLKDYHITNTVFPSDSKEFRKRIKERQKAVAGSRVYGVVMATLTLDYQHLGSNLDIEL